MPNEMRNIAGLFSNARTRLIIFVTLFLILLIVIVAAFSLRHRFNTPKAPTNLATVPGNIQSIPGSTTPTVQYARLQQTENVLVAERALKKGTSAIPTIIKSEKIEGDTPPPKGGETSVGFSGLLREEGGLSTKQLLEDELRKSRCSFQTLQKAKAAGFTLRELKDLGCQVCQLKSAGFDPKALTEVGFSACDLKSCGATAPELLKSGLTRDELKGAGFKETELAAVTEVVKDQCDVVSLRKAREQGVSAAVLKQRGCNASALRAAGFTAQELKDAGFSAAELRAAGFTAQQLKDAGFTATQLKVAGFNPYDLRIAGLTARQLLDAGFTPNQLASAGYTAAEINPQPQTPAAAASNQQNAAIQQVLARQAQQVSAQQYQQQMNQIKAGMQGQAQQLLAAWQGSPTQVLVAGTPPVEKDKKNGKGGEAGAGFGDDENGQMGKQSSGQMLKAGDVIYAVLNTAVNSDEPGPVLATVVSGKYNGARLVGSLATVGQNAQKVVLRFNVMSLPHQDKSISINAVAIDPKTARTALSSDTDNHYFQRFGLVFAASFLQGLGQAVSTSGATVTQNSQGQTTASNNTYNASDKAQIALGQVGQTAAQVFSKNVNRPPTIQVYSGVGMGILFLSDVDTAGQG